MAYYSLPKIKAPQPQVPLRVQGNRERFSETLQQRQGAIDQRKQEIQTGYVLQQLLNNPPPPPALGGLPPPVMPGMGMPARLPGFDDGGRVDTQEEEDTRDGGLGRMAGYTSYEMQQAANFVPGVLLDPRQVIDLSGQPGPRMGRDDNPLRSEGTLRDLLNYERGYRFPAYSLGGRVRTFAEGGDVYTEEEETEDERREREAKAGAEAAGAAAAMFGGRGGYMGGVSAFAPPPALPGAPIFGPAGLPPPTYAENVQAMVRQNPEAPNIAAGEAQANNVDANLANLRDYLPGNEKGPWYGPTQSPAQAQERVREELGPGVGGTIRDTVGDIARSTWQGAQNVQLPFMPTGPGGPGGPSPQQQHENALSQLGAAYNTDVPALSQFMRETVKPAVEDVPSANLLGRAGIHSIAGVELPDAGSVLAAGLPVTAGDWLANMIGAKGLGEVVTGLPFLDDALRAGLARAGTGLPGVRAGVMEGIRGGEQGAMTIPGVGEEPMGSILRRAEEGDQKVTPAYLSQLAANRGIDLGGATNKVDILNVLRGGGQPSLADQVRTVNQGLNPPPIAAAPPPDMGPVIPSRSGAPQSDFGDLPPRPMPPAQAAPPVYNYQPDIDWQGAVSRILEQRAAEAAAVGNVRLPGLVADEANLSRFLGDRTDLITQMRNAVGGERVLRESRLPQNAGLLPERAGLPNVMPMGPRSQPDVSGGFNFPTDAQGNRLGAAGLPESNSQRISRYMQEAQAKVEPGALPLPPREPPPPAREPLPSERLAGNAPAGAPAVPPGGTPAGWKLPEPGLLNVNDPERFEVSQRWAANQTNPPASSLTPQEMSTRLYNAGLESIASNRRDGSFTPPQLKQLADRYNYANGQGIKLPGEEPPSGMPDAFDLARAGRTPQGQAAAGSVRGLSLDEAEEQAARVGVDFDRELVEKGYKATADAEWDKLQKATDDFLAKENIAKSPEGKVAEADYMQRVQQEQAVKDPNAVPTQPPEGFPKEANTPALQRAYNTIAYAAYWSLGGDIGTFLRQDVMSMLNLANVPQSLEVIRYTARMNNPAGAAKALDELDARLAKALEGLPGKVNAHRPEVPGLRAGDSASKMESRELTQTPGLNKIPLGIGKFYEATSTMNAGLLYARRSLEIERFANNLPDRRFVLGLGNNVNSPNAKLHAIQAYANQVAVMGGRANLQYAGLRLGPALSKAGPLFTSLRFLMSVPERVPYLLPINRIAAGHWEIMGPQWREAARQHAGYAGALAGVLGAAGAAGAEVDWENGSFTAGGITVNLTGGVSKYWDAIQKGADGDWQGVADFFRNKTGPIPEDLFMAIQATGLDKATGTEEFFNYMRPEFFDRGFTGQAQRETPGLNWNTADRLAALVAPLFAGATVRAYIAAQKRDDNPFAAAAAVAGLQFFGADTRNVSSGGPLTQLRTNVKNDEDLDPAIRGKDFDDLGPKGKEEVNKKAEETSPEEYKEARKEADERNPVFAQHREQSQKITDEANQRKDDLYERFRNGDISGRQMTDGRKLVNEVARDKHEENRNNKEYKKAVDDLPEQNEVNKALKVYNAIDEKYTNAKGETDWDKVREKQAEFIRFVGETDRNTANLLLYEIEPGEKANALDRLMETAQPILSHYFGDLDGQPVQKANELRANPRDDALLNLLGYAQKPLTPEAGRILENMKATLPPANAPAAGAVQGSVAPAPAPAPAPQQTVAPIAAANKDYVFPVQGYSSPVNLHWGSDKGGSDLFAPRGTPVLAMNGGTVTAVGTDRAGSLGGNNVTIRGNDGRDYYYAHGNEAPQVRVGQVIPTGQYLFGVGDSGNAKGTGTHLHLGIGNGIISGSGATGGSGRDYDAVGLLNTVLNQSRSSPAPPAGGTDRASLQDYAGGVARANGINPEVFKGLIQHESSWRVDALNPKSGASGLGQMLPSTARGYGVTTEQLRNDPHLALDKSAQMLGELNKAYKGDEQKTYAAYFVGQGTVKEAVDAAGSGWLAYIDRIAQERYHQGTVSAYLRGVGAL